MAIVGPNIGLAIWNTTSDHFITSQLRDNWGKVEFHDHSPGRGLQIPTEGIMDGAITTDKIAPGTSTIGDGTVTAAKMAALPAVKVYNDATTTLPAGGTTTVISFNQERYDTDTMHSLVTNPDRLTVTTPGLYAIHTNLFIGASPSSGNALFVYVTKNSGSTSWIARDFIPYTTTGVAISTFARFLAGDYIQLSIWNNAGASHTLQAGTTTNESYCDFGMAWMAP